MIVTQERSPRVGRNGNSGGLPAARIAGDSAGATAQYNQPVPEEPIQVPVGLSPSSLGRRYLARSIDSVLLIVLTVILVQSVLAVADPGGNTSVVRAVLIFAALVFLWIGYGAAFESSPWQATLGKKIMGLRVYNSRAERLSPLQAIGRNCVKEGPFIVLGLVPGGQLLVFVWLGVHVFVVQRSLVNQAIHDRVAHTWVSSPEETTQLHLT